MYPCTFLVSFSSVSQLLLYLKPQNRSTQAFPQTPLDDPIYMRMPRGWFVNPTVRFNYIKAPKFHKKDHFVQLKKYIYGSKQAARNRFEYLTHKGVHPIKDLPLLITLPHHSYLIFVYTNNHLVFTCDEPYLWL
jgi:hypothetical protein